MKKREISLMPILTKEIFDNCKEVFTINKDYNLNGARLIVPKGLTLKFEGGSINNGTLVVNDTLLEGTEEDCINAHMEGTIRNSTIYTSVINGIDNLYGLSLSGKTIYCDLTNDVLNNTIVLNDTNTSLTTVFDGMNNTITCNANFFEIYGQSNIIIKNFNASAIAGNTNLEFEKMVTTATHVTRVQIINNTITGFKVGISLNNDSETYTVNNCIVSGNHVYNCPGSTSGSGYGIHMANARNCIISGNEVVNCGRHAIYHAYGENNIIINNEIKNHCIDYTTYSLWAAVEIGRKSKNVVIKGNTFQSCNNVCLLVYSPQYNQDGDGSTHLFRYGVCEGIVIEDNTFSNGTLTGVLGYLPYIYIGYEGADYSSLIQSGTYVADVTIIRNTFTKSISDNLKCIQVNQCQRLTIAGNTFRFGLPSSPQLSQYLIIDIPANRITGYETMMTIVHNTFTYSGPGAGNVYLLGPSMSLVVAPSYVIKWFANTLNYQIIAGITRYQLYQGTAGSGLINYD